MAGLALSANASFAADGTNDNQGSLLNNINFQIKHFVSDAATTGGAPANGLGFSYSIDKTIVSPSSNPSINMNFKADGNVAFDSNINPSDFLKTGFNLLYENTTTYPDDAGKCEPQNIDVTNKKMVDWCAKQFKTPSGFILKGGLSATLESDQKFDKKNNTYGGQLFVGYRPSTDSAFNNLNPFDWPFRLLRLASNHPWGSTASPDAFPKLQLFYDNVTPTNDKDREAILGNKNPYHRVNLELALTSPIGTIQGSNVKFEWSWRYFKEVSPPASIQAAKLDRFHYSAMSLKQDAGWRITYTSGQLPLDLQSNKVWELGYDFKLD